MEKKLNNEQLTEYTIALNEAMITNHGVQRAGQLAFNILHEMHPEVANYVRGTPVDPFYQDSLLEDFFRAITPEDLWINS